TLTIQRIVAILALNPPRLTVTLSLDGPPKQHDALRGVPGTWEGVMTVFEHFRRHPHPRLQLYFGFTLSDHTVGTLQQSMQAARKRFPDLDARIWHLNIAHQSAHYYDNATTRLLTPERATACVNEITSVLDAKKSRRFIDPVAFLECRYLHHARAFLHGQTHPITCRALDASLFLAADGTVYPCSIWDRPLGNLRDHDGDLSALLATTTTNALRTEIRSARCPGCWTPCDAYPTLLNHLLPDLSGPSRP
ncbi:MAG: radical SAM protein, partial [Magnetococcales bacterium]|nr:radical SAM protein [Magnetococcales bacterium]